MDESSATILKRDAVGRVVMPSAKREALLDEFERSSLSGAEFARLAGVKYPIFAGWVQRRRHDRGEYDLRQAGESSAGLCFLEAVVGAERSLPTAEAKTDGLAVYLPAGMKAVVCSQDQVVLLAQLLKAFDLASPC